jgi:undecaprenyl diphosphate synthase
MVAGRVSGALPDLRGTRQEPKTSAKSLRNWRRPKEEVDGLLAILGRAIETETDELDRQGAQLRHIGDLESLDVSLQRAIRQAIDKTRSNDRLVLTLAFNYGGRQELLRAMQHIVASGIAPEDIDEALIERHLYTHDLPDPDLIIRTSGETRLSNFLCWQGAYAELYFCSALWPDFGPEHLQAAVDDFGNRDRRFGALPATSASGL